VDPYEPSTAVLDRAVCMAEPHRARLTLLSVVPVPSPWVWLAPGLQFDPRQMLESDCVLRAKSIAGALPGSLSVVSLIRHGSLGGALLTELRTGAHDLAIMGIPKRRWFSIASNTPSGWRALRLSPVPVLVVSDESSASASCTARPGSQWRAIAEA
jgi:hypothetical protein